MPTEPSGRSQVRFCIDFRVANAAILRERHLTPTLDDIIYDLNGAAIVSKIDLNKVFHQMELHPDSRPITTFTTRLGIFRNKRLFFRCSAATEMFFVMQRILNCITNVRVICDDILVFGKSQR